METISNEEKAKEIAKSNGINYKNHSKYEDDMDSTLECYKSALEAMEWKDEEHAKEKQQWIDETIKWLEEQDFGGWIESETEELINEFKQFAKEEL